MGQFESGKRYLLTGYRITNGWARTNYTYFAISLSQPIRDYGYKDKEKVLVQWLLASFQVGKELPGNHRSKDRSLLQLRYSPRTGTGCESGTSLLSARKELLRICVPKLPERASNSWRKLPVQTGIMNWIILRWKVRLIRKQCSTLLFIIR